jgi:maltooligosyltrehalose trehalohydrolase
MNSDSLPQGAEVSASGVHYRVWAPKAAAMSIEILSANGRPLRSVPLSPADRGYFHGLDSLGAAGDRYKFRLDNGESLPDPASRWQPEGVHGPSMVVDPRSFQWSDGGWQRPPFRDLVIYELHVGAFTKKGTFRAAIEKLEHIRDFGANAIELMPIGDFGGGRNWGYDGVYLFAPSRAYGSPRDLRALVDAAHRTGLTVILDVVYNHFGPDGNYLHAYIGNYLDEAEKTPWGGAIRYAHPDFKPLRDLVVSNPGYWMREFHIDGFRFDATHEIFDDSPHHILQELTASIHTPGGFAIAEDERNDARLVMPEAEGGFGFDAVWADDFHHVVRVANTHEAESYLGDFAGTLSESVDTLRHGWHYRGQHAKSMARPRGTECAQLPPERFIHCISNHDQTGNHAFGERLSHRIRPAALRAAEALLCLTPYTPMLFMGQEWAASTPFLFFTDHNPELGKLIVQGRREEFKHFAAFSEPAVLDRIPNPQKPASFAASKLVWKERNRRSHARSLQLYKICLGLRASDPAFRPSARDSWRVEELSIGIGALRLQSATGDYIVLFDLHGGHEGSLRDEAIFQPAELNWTFILSTNETRFGGTGTCALDAASLHATFTTPETVVLRSLRVDASRNEPESEVIDKPHHE